MTEPLAAYDVSKYKGVSFLAKVGEGSTTALRFKIPTSTPTPLEASARSATTTSGSTSPLRRSGRATPSCSPISSKATVGAAPTPPR